MLKYTALKAGYHINIVEEQSYLGEVRIHFDFADPDDIAKVKRFERTVSVLSHQDITVEASDRAQFCAVIPKAERTMVRINNARHDDNALGAVVGCYQDATGCYIDLSKLPHLLIAGATGSGKSVALHTIITSMLSGPTSHGAQFMFIDCKRIEMAPYKRLTKGKQGNLLEFVTDPLKAAGYLCWACEEMDKRYALMERRGARNIDDLAPAPTRIVIVIDEFADLMLTSKSRIEPFVVRLAQLGRAAGIHLIIATQKPIVKVLPSLIQANIPARLALQVASTADSVRILGQKGAERLLGKGDALLKLPDQCEPIHIQCGYVEDAFRERIITEANERCKANKRTTTLQEILGGLFS